METSPANSPRFDYYHPPATVQGFGALLSVVKNAANFWPPNYVKSIMGPFTGWIPPFHKYSEFRIVDVWHPWVTAKYLINTAVPSLPRPGLELLPPLIEEVLWQPTRIFQYPDSEGSYNSYPEEHWFFINGILTNTEVAKLNARCLADLFRRPVTVIQNSTDGAVLDLLECSIGKEWPLNTEAATVAFPAIYDALTDRSKRRVVIICHSQGTIIMAQVLRGLKYLARRNGRPASNRRDPEELSIGLLASLVSSELQLDMADFADLTEDELAKLEIYAFANCATLMRYHTAPEGCPPIPWLENFGNQYDLVARLGMLAPNAHDQGISISGPAYVRREAWGHLLNEHYLLPMAAEQQKGNRRGGIGGARPFELRNNLRYPWAGTPRLYGYINGGTPKPYREMDYSDEDYGREMDFRQPVERGME